MRQGVPIALAQGAMLLSLSLPALAGPTWYGVFKGGWTDFDYPDLPSGIDTTDSTFSLLAGMQFDFNPSSFSAGLEAGPVWLGRYGPDDNLSVGGLEAAVVGVARVATGTDLFVRTGVLGWDAKVRGARDEDGLDPLYGLGFRYGLDNLRFRGSVDWYELDDVEVEAYTLGFDYRFQR
ncbi:MAG: hypothetical protein VX379_11220 [Pseudomonadota bacterium]|nr:hypothetical protein [Pseudomonadota bacterium]MEE3319299.1 hypothetical protein [Pseudomonadota bacterium]